METDKRDSKVEKHSDSLENGNVENTLCFAWSICTS